MMYIKALRKFSIKFRLMASLLIGIILFSSILLYASGKFSEYLIKSQLFSYLELTQREIGVDLEYTLDKVNSTNIRLLSNDDIYSLLQDNNLSHREKENNLNTIFNSMSINKQIIAQIYIITNNGEQFNINYPKDTIEKPDENYINKIRNTKGTIAWGAIKKDADGNAYLLEGNRYRNFLTGQDIGCLILYIRESVINDIYNKKTPYGGYSFLISDNNYIISDNDKSKIGDKIFDDSIFRTTSDFTHDSETINGKPAIITISNFDDKISRLNCYWKIVSIINKDKLFSIVKKINTYIIIIVLIISIVTIFISISISSRIVNPIRLLKNKLKNFGEDNTINPSLYRQPQDEIWELEKCYNEMTSRISNLIGKNNEEKEKQRKLELTALQAQINPHFLYNTLDAIGWIAKMKKQKDIESLVLALAQFFRISLHKGDKFISLKEEIELIKSYVIIELIRFPDKFDIDFNVDEDILDNKILKITLQPIVENAIKHGLGPKDEKGHILVTGKKQDNYMLLEVIDDGIGFNISEALTQNKNNNKFSGYGIKNVDERIKLEYGKDCGISIQSIVGNGTCVKIKLGLI